MTVAALPVTALDFGNAVRAYHGLMRHRIANPLTVISGMAQTLRDVDLDAEQQQQLLDAIIDQAGRLSRISLEPRCVEPIEYELEPWPQWSRARRVDAKVQCRRPTA